MKKFLIFSLCFICLVGINKVNAEESVVDIPTDTTTSETTNESNVDTNIGENNSNIDNTTSENDENEKEEDTIPNEDSNTSGTDNNTQTQPSDIPVELNPDTSVNNTHNQTNSESTQKEEEKVETSINQQPQTNYVRDELPKNSTFSYTSSTEEEKSIDVKISNIDLSTKKQLIGSKLSIEDEEGNTLYDWESKEEEFIITDLDEGTYYLVVLSVPEGYEVKEEKIEFTVDYDLDEIEVKVENNVVVAVPNTLSSGSILLLSIAMIDIAIGIWIIVYVKKSKVKE